MRLLQQAPSAAAMSHIEALGRRLGIMLQSCAVAMLLRAVCARLLPLVFQPHLPTDAAAAGGGVCCCSICQPQLKKLQVPQPQAAQMSLSRPPLCAAAQARAPQDEGQLCIAHSGVKVSAGGPPTKHPTGVLPDGCAAQGLRWSLYLICCASPSPASHWRAA